jgi:hypothetical protein
MLILFLFQNSRLFRLMHLGFPVSYYFYKYMLKMQVEHKQSFVEQLCPFFCTQY